MVSMCVYVCQRERERERERERVHVCAFIYSLWLYCYTVTFDLEPSAASPAVISYTKKPKKKGFSLKKVFKLVDTCIHTVPYQSQ